MTCSSKYREATGGFREVPHSWMSGSALRPLYLDSPCLVWLKYHGAKYGFQQDPDDYSFLGFLGDLGREFEAKWCAENAPHSPQGLNEDWEVRQCKALRRTLALMDAGEPVIRKAALMWAPARLFGTADLIVKQSWMFWKYPHLKPRSGDCGHDHYIVVDVKMITGLDTPEKQADLLAAQSQVRLYTYMLGHLQEYMPRHAYLVCRDRHESPLLVEGGQQLNHPLSRDLAVMRDAYLHIKLSGSHYVPWRDPIVAPNYRADAAPWCNAHKEMAHHRTPGRALELLPGIGSEAVKILRAEYKNLDALLEYDPAILPLETLPGIGKTKAAKLRAVLLANQEGRPSRVPPSHVPPKANVELMVDFEYISINPDIENDWPHLTNRERLFMIGVGWDDEGAWHYRQFVAEEDTERGERDMLLRFIECLQDRGIFGSHRTAALYHWSSAEVTQSSKAAARHDLPQLADLPWRDLQKPFHNTPIGVPDAFGWGLKEIAKALGDYAPEYKVEWPEELGVGLAAMVMGIEAYKSEFPLETNEMKVLAAYLESDVFALQQILRWLRASAVEHGTRHTQASAGGWYTGVAARQTMQPPVLTGGWYHYALQHCR